MTDSVPIDESTILQAAEALGVDIPTVEAVVEVEGMDAAALGAFVEFADVNDLYLVLQIRDWSKFSKARYGNASMSGQQDVQLAEAYVRHATSPAAEVRATAFLAARDVAKTSKNVPD